MKAAALIVILALATLTPASMLPQNSGAIEGVVLRADTSEAIEDAAVTLYVNGLRTASATTEASGRFSFRGLSSGQYLLQVAHDGFGARATAFHTASPA